MAESHVNGTCQGMRQEAVAAVDENAQASSIEVPPEFEPRMYGEKYIEPVRLGDLIMLSQTRDELNPALDEMADSIERNGLVNQIDVARMPEAALAEYIDFVNNIWSAEHRIDTLPVAADGYHYLVIAGHSRTQAMIRNESSREKEAIDAGYETHWEDASVYCKIMEAPTPEHIITLQLEENIHHQVPRERQAMCIVETYQYGLSRGIWNNQAEFLRQNKGRFSQELLRNALLFSALPESAREQVLVGALKYSTAVALGKVHPHHLQYCLFRYFDSRPIDTLTQEEVCRLACFSEEWLGVEIATIQNQRLTATAARKRFKSYQANWEGEMSASDGEQPVLIMEDPIEAFRTKSRQQRRHYRRLLGELAGQPLRTAAQAVAIHDQLAFRVDEEPGREQEAERAKRQFIESLSRTAIGQQLATAA